MHVVNPRRAGRHAGEAGKATVDVENGFGVWNRLSLQHLLDLVDAATGAVEFVPQHLIGRAGRGAEPAMDAGSEDLVRTIERRRSQLFLCEMGLHVWSLRRHQAGVQHARRVKLIAQLL